MTQPARQISLLLPPLALMGLIFYLSSQPDLGTGLGVWDLIGRKLVHLTIFGLLTAAWYRALASLVPAVIISALFAVSDEIHQSFVQGRHGSPVDVAIDFVGISIAAYLIFRLTAK